MLFTLSAVKSIDSTTPSTVAHRRVQGNTLVEFVRRVFLEIETQIRSQTDRKTETKTDICGIIVRLNL